MGDGRNLWCGFLRSASAALTVVALFVNRSYGASQKPADSSKLIALAAADFPDLSRAEIALLRYVDTNNVERGDNAVSGPSDNPEDATNDPAHAEAWGPERTIRARLIRWLCTYPDAVKLVDPGGINILGARIIGGLDLGALHVPFQLSLFGSWIPDGFEMYLTEIPSLPLLRCRFSHFIGGSMTTRGDLTMGNSQTDGEVYLEGSKLGGGVAFFGARLRHSSRAAESRPGLGPPSG